MLQPLADYKNNIRVKTIDLGKDFEAQKMEQKQTIIPTFGRLELSSNLEVSGHKEGYCIDVLGTPGALAKDMQIKCEPLGDEDFLVRNVTPLGHYEPKLTNWLIRWANERPEVIFLAERWIEDRTYWHMLNYRETLKAVRSLAQALLDMNLDSNYPVVVLSGNSVRHGLLTLACFMIGHPIATVSVAYSLKTSTYDRLNHILSALKPALIYAEDGAQFSDALHQLPMQAPIVNARHVLPSALDFDGLLEQTVGSAVDDALNRVGPSTVARLLLTSGSTGTPKIVENTHGMLSANQTMIAQCWPFVHDSQPIVLDWLPWSHTFGANHNFNIVLRNGGSLYIDDGLPLPGMVERTIENLKLIKPTLFFNVPRGYDMLLPLLQADKAATEALFSRLQILFYAAAALPEKTWQQLEVLGQSVRSVPFFFTSEWGATETSPVITNVHFKLDGPGNLGVPVPGTAIKFVAAAGKYEMRVKSPSVFTSYRNNPDLTRDAFDEDGFYKIQDAGRLVNPSHPEQGILFDGRVSEDFKLSSGTWVWVGTLRVRAVSALAPWAQDVVVAGHSRDEVGLLIFPSAQLVEKVNALNAPGSWTEMGKHPDIQQCIQMGLQEMADHSGTSQCARRALILGSHPNIDKGEITDKGYINQMQVLLEREADVQRLYSEDDCVIKI